MKYNLNNLHNLKTTNILIILITLIILILLFRLYKMNNNNTEHFDENKIIIPDIIGGLGNQLFVVASAFAYSKDNNYKLMLDNRKDVGSYGKPRPTYNNTVFYNSDTGELTYNASSKKYKTNIIDLTQNTSNIYNLVPREFDYVDGTHCVGLIAEEVDAVDTFLSTKNDDRTPGNINWFALTTYMLKEIQKGKR